MKRIIYLAVLLVLIAGIYVMGAAPAANNRFIVVGDTITVDSQHTGTWELLDTVIVVKTDTCYTLYTLTGYANLDPWDVLYLGFGDGGGAAQSDTFEFHGPKGGYGKTKMPFIIWYVDSLIGQTDENDSINVYGAVRGSSQGEKVLLENVLLEVQVIDAIDH